MKLCWIPFLTLLASVTAQHSDRLMYSVAGDTSSDNFGAAMAFVGDVNSDGHDDFVSGARLDDDKGTNSGSARVFSGIDGSTLVTFFGDAAADQLGYSVSGAGDVNGDGHDDIIAGAPFAAASTGYARVFSGKDATASQYKPKDCCASNSRSGSVPSSITTETPKSSM